MLIAPKCVLWLYSEDPDEMLHYAVFHQGLIYTIAKTETIFRERSVAKIIYYIAGIMLGWISSNHFVKKSKCLAQMNFYFWPHI